MRDTSEQYQDDEIDLRELLTALWKSKILIIAITIIFSIAGFTYAYLAPQVWSAKAMIVAPLPTQMEQLQLRLDNLIAIMDITTKNRISDDNRNTNDHRAFLATFTNTKLYSDFLRAFDSFDNKSEFLKTIGYVRSEDKEGANTPQRTLESMTQNISVNKKEEEGFITLSFSFDDAEEARKLLIEYLSFIQGKEVAAKNKLLADKVTSQTNVLTLTYQILQAETLKRLQEDITRTEYALRISRTAGIEAPVENLNNESIFAIDLGAKALNEKLNILREIKNPEIINSALADVRLHLDSLQAVPQEKVSFTSYHFLQSPTEPLSRDKPKRSLVVMLATFAGLMMGVVVALFRASSFCSGATRG
jgi:LPS O-antigen subunit length determinant protein (WzzB/FepE family)